MKKTSKTEKKLPIIYLTIDESIDPNAPKENGGDGVSRISLVRSPAIESDFMTFSTDGKYLLKFKTTDKSKQIITGAVLIPDKEIYRSDEKMGEFYAVFDSHTIEKVVEKYMRSKKTDSVNLEHSTPIEEGVYVMESWIVADEKNDKANSLGFSDVKKGSWYISMKIDNQEVWNNFVSTGKVRGFSLEGIFNLVRPKDMPTQMAKQTCLSERQLNRCKLKKVLLMDFINKNVTKKSKVKWEKYSGTCKCRSCLELMALGKLPFSCLPENMQKEVWVEAV